MKTSDPLVTVLMPVYNGEKYLSEAINSILYQTYENFEFLIIDDFSNDQSIEIIKSFPDKRIKLIINEENIGQSKTLNKGIEFAKGKYIARLDQDDLCKKERLEKQLKYFINNDVTIVGSWASVINKKSSIKTYLQYPTNNEDIINAMGINSALAHSSVMMNKKDVLSVNGYSEEYKIAMDWDLWIRLIKNGFKIENIPEYLLGYRLHEDQSSLNKDSKKELFYEIITIMSYSVSLITRKPNYNAYLGWKYYFILLLCIQSLDKFYKINNCIKNIFNIRGLFELIKLFYYHKIIRTPKIYYDVPIISIKK